MPSPIPIENLYYLFCYAWGHFKEGRELVLDTTECSHLLDLLARVLVNGVSRLRRRGLDRGYVEFQEELREIRGRICFDWSLKRFLLVNGKAACAFDELDQDILNNRIIKSTLSSLVRARELEPIIRKEVQLLDQELKSIRNIRVQKTDFSRNLHRNNVFYNLVLNICELIYDLMLPTEKTGKSRFSDIMKNEIEMSDVFEEFVRNFHKAEHKNHKYEVAREHIKWIVSDATEDDKKYLPIMKTDVCLKSSDRKIIVDTKYYKQTFDVGHEGYNT